MDTVKHDISKMFIKPLHCPMTPVSYTAFYNNKNEVLKPVAPYKIIKEPHKRDGILIPKIEYNNFYTHWKRDSVNWYPRGEYSDSHLDNSNSNNNKILNMGTFDIDKYNETKKPKKFAMPLPINGTNQIHILFNDKCNIPTFRYKRYAEKPITSNSRYSNSLYEIDISKETQQLKDKWMDSTVSNSMDLYSSVFEDMTILDSYSSKTN